MVFPCPARRHGATGHGADWTFDPNCSINVHDDCTNEYEAAQRVQQRAPADHAYREILGKVSTPNDDTGQEQAGQTQDDPGIAAMLWKVAPGFFASSAASASSPSSVSSGPIPT